MTTSTSGAMQLRNFVQAEFQAQSAIQVQAGIQPQPNLTVPPDISVNDDDEILRIIAIGTRPVVRQHIMRMYQLGYAQPHEWSRPLPTANPNKIMRIMTRRVGVIG